MKGDVNRESPDNAAESKTPCMCGNSVRENRESQAVPTRNGRVGRSGKAQCRTPDMYASWQSDGPVVPAKRANKVAGRATGLIGRGVGGGKGTDQGERTGDDRAEGTLGRVAPGDCSPGAPTDPSLKEPIASRAFRRILGWVTFCRPDPNGDSCLQPSSAGSRGSLCRIRCSLLVDSPVAWRPKASRC
jgi:hypothetical protein